jgi:hypothetical protein
LTKLLRQGLAFPWVRRQDNGFIRFGGVPPASCLVRRTRMSVPIDVTALQRPRSVAVSAAAGRPIAVKASARRRWCRSPLSGNSSPAAILRRAVQGAVASAAGGRLLGAAVPMPLEAIDAACRRAAEFTGFDVLSDRGVSFPNSAARGAANGPRGPDEVQSHGYSTSLCQTTGCVCSPAQLRYWHDSCDK